MIGKTGYDFRGEGRLKDLTHKQISYLMIEACKQYAPLNEYVRNLYGKELTYVRGLVLERDEWSENRYEDVPMILIDPVKKTFSENENIRRFVFGIQTKVVHKDEYFGVPRSDPHVEEYTGIDEVEMINLMILEAFLKHPILACLKYDEVEMYEEPVRFLSNHTEYNGFITINFSAYAELCIGGNLLQSDRSK